jgi:hypothetical protein
MKIRDLVTFSKTRIGHYTLFFSNFNDDLGREGNLQMTYRAVFLTLLSPEMRAVTVRSRGNRWKALPGSCQVGLKAGVQF